MSDPLDDFFPSREPSTAKKVFWRLAWIVPTLLICIFIASTIVGCVPDYSQGERVGVVTKLSYKGIIWKSWEGALNEGGTRVGVGQDGKRDTVPNVMQFNVQDPAIVKTLQSAMNTGRRVKITYAQWMISPAQIDSPYVVKSAVVVD